MERKYLLQFTSTEKRSQINLCTLMYPDSYFGFTKTWQPGNGQTPVNSNRIKSVESACYIKISGNSFPSSYRNHFACTFLKILQSQLAFAFPRLRRVIKDLPKKMVRLWKVASSYTDKVS